MNENKKIYPNSSFNVKNNTKLKIHFSQTIADLKSLFNANDDENFKNLISADFCHFDTSLVTRMNFMFYECISLQTLHLSNFNTLSVENMESMFYECSSLKTLYLSNFDTSSVTIMNSMFYGCSLLQTL